MYKHSIYFEKIKIMETIIKKWGNSLGVRIPNLMAKELSLKEGSVVEIKNEENKIIIKTKQKNSLADMLKNINESNLHNEFNTSTPMGKEVW